MLGATPEQSLYIGDTIYDVRASKEADMISAAITTGYHSAEDLEAEDPDYLFHALSDMKTLIV
jgi:pyrophosphatase PpaX